MEESETSRFMDCCLELAKQALRTGNPPVGSVIVKDGEIVGEGIEQAKSSGDIRRHAEIEAIRDAQRRNEGISFEDAVMLTTHEPCIMCSYAIRQVRISKVIFGCAVDDVGGFTSDFGVLCSDKVPKWGAPPLVQGEVLEAKCDQLNREYRELLETRDQ